VGDHLIALDDRVTGNPGTVQANLAPQCVRCSSSKGNRPDPVAYVLCLAQAMHATMGEESPGVARLRADLWEHNGLSEVDA
jgi:hypothetical protein